MERVPTEFRVASGIAGGKCRSILRMRISSARGVGDGGDRWRRGTSDGSYRGGKGVQDAGGGDAEGEYAGDQQHAQGACGPVEADGGPVTRVAEDGFAHDAEVVIDSDGGVEDGDDDQQDVTFLQGGGTAG